MLLKGIRDEDFTQYKLPSMFLVFPTCDFKCCREAGNEICQNCELAHASTVEVEPQVIVDRYLKNPITKSIVCGGLEPFDSFEDLLLLIKTFRWDNSCFDPIVIYTGYYPEEIFDKLSCLSKYSNLIVKFGRFIPDQKPHFDEILGVELASDNQWAEEI